MPAAVETGAGSAGGTARPRVSRLKTCRRDTAPFLVGAVFWR
jgi:hypothetical protein